ncbi:cupin-like domain-containing protein [Parvularcula marina]|uniref:cupin-like domain-containing protein n=1 Tax=Parvularcula marina TaxID=2292771 RepID=UPI003515B67D
MSALPHVRIIEGVTPDRIPFGELIAEGRPVLMKAVVRDWPAVAAGAESPSAAIDYLKRFYGGAPVTGFTGPPEIGGRFFYNDEMTGLNFTAARVRLDGYLDEMAAHLGDDQASSYYVGSTDVDGYLPGFRAENDLPLAEQDFAKQLLVSIWIGTRTTATAHYDISNNMACCLVGDRRFTLFPPDQVANLYPGPLEPTPGGQVVSMVDFRSPDFERFPRFREALAAGQVAEMSPGDVLFYPALWWHHVEALSDFNVMMNYWWNDVASHLDTPQNTLLHGLLSLRDRPASEKAAWKGLFDYYIFGEAEEAGAHLPDHAKGPLGPMDEMTARRLRAMLLRRLNR